MRASLKHRMGLLIVVCLGGCIGVQHADHGTSSPKIPANRPKAATYWDKVGALQNDLTALNPHTDQVEARQVAETAIGYSSYLAEEYSVIRPAVLHNVFVRLGLKDRGLCYHWTEDLLKQLQSLDLKTYQLHWGVAHRGSDLKEHNSVVITASGEAFAKGIVLDPWRNSGDLYWALVETDRYPWQTRPPSEW